MHSNQTRVLAGFLALVGVTAGSAALAQNSVSQATVMASGGFPYVIGTPGSYKLIGSLQVTPGAAGIEITATGWRKRRPNSPQMKGMTRLCVNVPS